MRFLLAILMGLLITGSPAAGAEGDIVEVSHTSLRYDARANELYMTVVGKNDDGKIIYKEKKLDETRIYVNPECYYKDKDSSRFFIYHHYVIYVIKGNFFLLGEAEKIEYQYAEKENVTNAKLYIPWTYRTDKQEFELNIKTNELSNFNYHDDEKKVSREPDDSDELKSKALQGDEGAIATLKDRGLWN